MTSEFLKGKEFKRQPVQGEIYVICGPMFSGKSTTLISELETLKYGKRRLQIFAPEVDNRRGKDSINSQNGLRLGAVSVKNSVEILKLVKAKTDVVAIDEAQFFDERFPDVCTELARRGKRVIVAGLDKDFRGEPFGQMGKLKDIAEHVTTKVAGCEVCGRAAGWTQRMVEENGHRRPANYDEPIVLVGGTDIYSARCRDHHEVPGRPEIVFKESRLNEKICFLLSGQGPVEDEVEKVLERMGHKVYRPPIKGEKYFDLQTDEERAQRQSCDVAIFGPGKNSGIGEVREWFQKSKKPSMVLVQNFDPASWASATKQLCDYAERVDDISELEAKLTNFISDLRIGAIRRKK